MENNNTNQKPKLEEAGAFWIKKSKTGNSFLTGTIKTKAGEEIKVIVFKNKYKTEGSNQPDYRVYFDSQIPTLEKPASKAEKEIVNKKNTEVKQSEEIPF